MRVKLSVYYGSKLLERVSNRPLLLTFHFQGEFTTKNHEPSLHFTPNFNEFNLSHKPALLIAKSLLTDEQMKTRLVITFN